MSRSLCEFVSARELAKRFAQVTIKSVSHAIKFLPCTVLHTQSVMRNEQTLHDCVSITGRGGGERRSSKAYKYFAEKKTSSRLSYFCLKAKYILCTTTYEECFFTARLTKCFFLICKIYHQEQRRLQH